MGICGHSSPLAGTTKFAEREVGLPGHFSPGLDTTSTATPPLSDSALVVQRWPQAQRRSVLAEARIWRLDLRIGLMRMQPPLAACPPVQPPCLSIQTSLTDGKAARAPSTIMQYRCQVVTSLSNQRGMRRPACFTK